jgi:hypothetical protein
MIMDEATAAIGDVFFFKIGKLAISKLPSDYETDSAIQESIRATLGSDITIITIAHRLQTIMDSDKIVCGFGRLIFPKLCPNHLL